MRVWVEEAQDFRWVPIYRAQMIYWLECRYHGDKSFKKMRNSQLRAIIISCFRKKAKEEYVKTTA